MSITAIVENDTIKLPMHVPDGTKVEITLPNAPDAGTPGWLQRAVGAATSGLTTDEIMRATRGED
jgi:hypothetical protein